MEDALIVDLYWARDEQALAETAAKFGTYCRKIADNILHSAHDAEECENDTWLAAWNSMPTNRPARLAPYLGRITRNLALDRFDRAAAQKRGSGQTCVPLDELAHPPAAPVERRLYLSDYLPPDTSRADRRIVRLRLEGYRYQEIAEKMGMTEIQCRVRLFRLREKLKKFEETLGNL